MDRTRWLAERRAEVEREYTAEGPTYDEYDPATPVHRRFVSRLIGSVPAGGAILDAACGTAPYAGMVIAAGLGYVGADQSGGMLNVARAKWPDARFELGGLQELPFEGSFEGVMCTDAMENVPPEEWPVVVSAFARALRPGGHLYLTTEEIDRAQIEEAFTTLKAAGFPAVFGELIEGDTAGYHFYPDRERADRWLTDAGFQPIEDADEWLDGYGYRHLLLQRGRGQAATGTSATTRRQG
jgi:ubiquinone/menaquinone biosynthesis C-methylase UbiE